MAITVTTLRTLGPAWSIHGYSADAQGNETLKDAVSGKSHYIRKIMIHTVSAITVTLNADTTAILGPILFATTAGAPVTYEFVHPVKVTAGAALKVDAGGAGAVNVIVEGFTAD